MWKYSSQICSLAYMLVSTYLLNELSTGFQGETKIIERSYLIFPFHFKDKPRPPRRNV
jgi:hypothetical protein